MHVFYMIPKDLVKSDKEKVLEAVHAAKAQQYQSAINVFSDLVKKSWA